MSAETRVLRLSIIGCGAVGKTLARLWREQKVFQITDILNKEILSAERAREFVGAGRVATSFAEMGACDVLLLSVPDDQIASVAESFSKNFRETPPKFVFHTSGAYSSELLRSFFAEVTSVASVHPVKSFASSEQACLSFENTLCAMEGEQAALDFLSPVFERIGARVFQIPQNAKTLYHCGLVLGCNYLVTLAEMAERCLQLAGVEPGLSSALLSPLMLETVDNLRRFGPEIALTGPIVRGDSGVVQKHLDSIEQFAPQILPSYRALGLASVTLAEKSGRLSSENARKLENALS